MIYFVPHRWQISQRKYEVSRNVENVLFTFKFMLKWYRNRFRTDRVSKRLLRSCELKERKKIGTDLRQENISINVTFDKLCFDVQRCFWNLRLKSNLCDTNIYIDITPRLNWKLLILIRLLICLMVRNLFRSQCKRKEDFLFIIMAIYDLQYFLFNSTTRL